MATYTSTFRNTLIYVFAIADEQHRGCLKIGETTLNEDLSNIPAPNSELLNATARKRIDQYTQTAGINYQLVYTESTIYLKNGKVQSFNDKQVHAVLARSGVKRKVFKTAKNPTEWYVCDLETIKRAITSIKEGKESLSSGEVTHCHSPIIFRPEQQKAIKDTLKQFRKGKQMLWNAKMRFGKTLCALQVALEMRASKTLIITHRPVVDAGWFEDFGKIFYDHPEWHYGSHNNGESFASLQKLSLKGKNYIYFASMQDIRGSKEVGGKFDKNNEVFSTAWNLVIVDEAHEGTQTELGKAVFEQIIGKHTKVLRLSGTPFNLLDFHQESEVFTWDYIMEQRAKQEWESTHVGEPNPYASLPAIHIYTYDLGRLLSEYSDEENAFNFREFFRTKEDGGFVHDADIDRFLALLTTYDSNSLYPYSSDYFRTLFRHSLWILPGVKAAKALSQKLNNHEVFGAFKVVNVAGDGDEEEENRDALDLVNKAIGPDPEDTYTITLSCGRLTTGVSVKPWTGVFMMAGSYSTSAAGYMQTIFRVQTPYTHNGRMKTDCYAFDFAPDRTLRVLAEVAKTISQSNMQGESVNKVLGDFLNFCPIIAIEGGKMRTYDVNAMLGQLKKVQIDKVVQAGFEDGALYNENLLKLTDIELKEFKELKGIIGKTQAMPKVGEININRQGFLKEQYTEQSSTHAKSSSDSLSVQEEERRRKLKEAYAHRREAISILRGISIRMPLMLYGANIEDENEELTIDNFTNLVDNQSWNEFMPRGVTKKLFQNFKRYYDSDVFREAGKRIRQIARMADDAFTIEERISRITDIFATFRNPDKETVLTPWRVVNLHLANSLGGYCFMDEDFNHSLITPRYVHHEGITSEVFSPQSTILEINSKSGLYPLYATYTIYRKRLEEAREKYGEISKSSALMIWDRTLEENIFVVCKTPMAKQITIRTLCGFRHTTVHATYFPNLIEKIIQSPNQVAQKLQSTKFWNIHKNYNMKIDAIIGNPPYQVMVEDNNRAKPVYHLFIDIASQLSQRVSLITPARYLFNAGFTPSEWNNKVLNDEHFKVVLYKANSTDLFPSVDIKGGVAVMYRDSKQNFGKIRIFKAYQEITSISSKVEHHGNFSEGAFAELISSRGMYRFSKVFYDEYPKAKEIQAKGTGNMITSNAFELFPEIFLESQPTEEEYIRIYGRYNNERCYRWIKFKYISLNNYLKKYNVFVPKSNSSGAIGEAFSTPLIGEPLIGEPLIGVTDTFISIGAFDTRAEAEACLKYIKTKFARTMLGILKVTQDNPKDTWRFVPLQDFSEGSDIDWTQSVADIDRQLYRKYGLDEGEIAFIEEKVRAME